MYNFDKRMVGPRFGPSFQKLIRSPWLGRGQAPFRGKAKKIVFEEKKAEKINKPVS
jgi:hypothetical protein